MKHELRTRKVGNDAEGNVEFKIVKQTHRGEEFNPNVFLPWEFKYKKIRIICSNYPNVTVFEEGIIFNVRGCEQEKDNNTCKCTEAQYKLIQQAVRAYNKQYKNEV